jgi:peptidase E
MVYHTAVSVKKITKVNIMMDSSISNYIDVLSILATACLPDGKKITSLN